MAKKKVVLKVEELEKILADYHHSDCWKKTKAWFNPFGKNIQERAKFLKANMYTPKPLVTADGKGKVAAFSILQGDIIKTKSAITYEPLFDFKQEEYSYYMVVPSSCSVQPNKYRQVLLARLSPIENIDGAMKNAFVTSIKFENNKSFYLPPIDGESLGEFGFLAVFEEISHIDNKLLQSVQRLASLSRIGWHLLNAFLVNHFTRPSSDDTALRESKYDVDWSFYE
jgi:hypothetical protein